MKRFIVDLFLIKAMKQALFWKQKNSKAQCKLCPRNCIIEPNNWGFCRARKNINGKLQSMVYAKAIAANIDPIEKKPLYHVLPKSKSFSVGTAGCNLRCAWCQNWQSSQSRPDQLHSIDLPPEKIIKNAKQNNCKSIAYTYTEPFVFYEYMKDTAELAQKQNVKNVAVSNGFIEQEPIKEASKFLDAVNIDLKSFDDKTYRKHTTAWLQPVLDTLKTLKQNNVWVEITNLIIPDVNDDFEMIEKMILWIKENLGAKTPLHFSAFYPSYKMSDKKPTPIETVKKARKLAINKGMKFVYTGNILDDEGSTTFCPACKKLVIKRHGFNIAENKLKEGKCSCGEKIPGIWR
ncbi:AmmeMemoRadiSam system radical SAM enzyme [Candidatus Woesearchaeota archaeon]|nr:AmmeMemoRadiSam system radical SAM enzyme [Candidatus Woesearchaeota archaeon]